MISGLPLTAALFDLDGTLLDNEVSQFIPRYFALLAEKFSGFCSRENFYSAMREATQAMIENSHPTRTNQEVFWEVFLELTRLERETIMGKTEEFYRNDFPTLRGLTRPVDGARRLLMGLFERGFRVVVATNPLFPRVAIVERLRWAGVQDLPFSLVTSYENMHFTKPHPEYYQEILECIGARAEESIMVGNSLKDDMAAKKAGLYTFFVTSEEIISEDEELVDAYGSLNDLQPLLLT